MRWGDSGESGRAELLPFDPWLVRTGRRELVGQNNPPWLEAGSA